MSYILGLSGLTGNTGSVVVPTEKAGEQIALDDFAMNDQGTTGSLEVSGGSWNREMPIIIYWPQ